MSTLATQLAVEPRFRASFVRLAAALICLAAEPSWAETIYVPRDFASIAAATRAAAPYDTIIVAAGRYDESVVLDKPITLLGEQRGTSPSAAARSGGESTIAGRFPIRITSPEVRIIGFEITDFEQGITIEAQLDLSAVSSTKGAYDITISENWIHSEQPAVRAGVRTTTHSARNLLISRNLIDVRDGSPSTAPHAAIELNGSPERSEPLHYQNVVVSSNILQNRDGNSEQEGGYGLFGGARSASDIIEGLVVQRNYFRNATYGANFNVQNVLQGIFSGNIIEDAAGALGFYSGTISGNTFRSGGRLVLWATTFDPVTTGESTSSLRLVSVRNNEFSGEVTGRAVTVGYGILSSTISLRRNAFRNSGISGELVQNFATGVLHAPTNWWDNSSGPAAHTGSLLGPIDTSLWLEYSDEHPDAWQAPDYWPFSVQEHRSPGFWPAR
jgi:hypothetical protein